VKKTTTHGAAVSAVAKTGGGKGHGKAVSAVAKSSTSSALNVQRKKKARVARGRRTSS